MCYQRDAGDSGDVPSCTGNANSLGTGAEDYCIIRPSSTFLSSVYDHFEESNEGKFPIGLCSGDCDFGKRIFIHEDGICFDCIRLTDSCIL